MGWAYTAVMNPGLISVLFIGYDGDTTNLRLPNMADYEASEFDLLAVENDNDIEFEIALKHFHSICTFGNLDDFSNLNRQQLEIRQRWLHYPDTEVALSDVAYDVMATFLDLTLMDRFPETPLVSVFTPTYKTGVTLLRAYQSLLTQSYDNWEWVIYDDSPDDKTFDIASSLAGDDHRIRVFRSSEPCGLIGEVKRRACGLAKGDIFVELDHDDELTVNCLGDLVEAFEAHPEAGFAYTDCAEVLENGENATYGDGYAFGFGSYRYEDYFGKTYAVTNYPSVNSKTVRHIVGMPNHARAWRREAYFAAGGHNSEIPVADDYELCIRTFLTTRMVHVKRFGYIQHIDSGGSNTQRVRNKEIQRLVRFFADRYNQQIHDRFVELGADDFIWTEEGLDWSQLPTENHEANLTLL